MATSKEDILKAIEEMSVMDLVDLISDLGHAFFISFGRVSLALALQPFTLGRAVKQNHDHGNATDKISRFQTHVAASQRPDPQGWRKPGLCGVPAIDPLGRGRGPGYRANRQTGECELRSWWFWGDTDFADNRCQCANA